MYSIVLVDMLFLSTEVKFWRSLALESICNTHANVTEGSTAYTNMSDILGLLNKPFCHKILLSSTQFVFFSQTHVSPFA